MRIYITAVIRRPFRDGSELRLMKQVAALGSSAYRPRRRVLQRHGEGNTAVSDKIRAFLAAMQHEEDGVP
jgi:hypothetical protein